MSTEIAVAVITASVGGATIVGNIIVGRWNARSIDRKSSGTVDTSEAAQLWAESNALRQEYKVQAEVNQKRAENLEAQLEEVNAKLLSVMGELTKLKANSDTMIQKIDELKKIIANLRAENERLLKLKSLGAGA